MNDNELINEKIAQATELLDEFDIDVWLTFVRETPLTPDPAMDLIAGGHLTWHSAFLITRRGENTAIAGQYDAENIRSLGAYRIITYDRGIGKHLLATLETLQLANIALNYSTSDVAADGLSHGLFLTLQELVTGTPFAGRFVSAERLIGALRGRKTAAEVARMKAAIATTQQLFDQVEQFARPGMTQKQIAVFVHKRIDEMGLDYAWDRQYNPIVTCGPQSAIGHAAPGNVALQKGHTLHLDLGVKQNGYCSDLQRMWYVLDDGEDSAPADVQHAFQVVYGAIKAGESALRPGVRGWEVDEVAREFIVDNGFPEYMHAFGHLLGRSAHDGATVLGPQWEKYADICERKVEAGNVFTLELHVPVPDRGIMSLEEDVLVTADGVEYLSDPQTELRYIQ